MIVISGPSGVGKDSVIQRMKERELPFYFVVTATSRAPRPGEREGVDYLFVSREEFEKLIQHGKLLEHADVYGEYKGVPKAQVRKGLRSGKDIILRLDVQGADTLRKLYSQVITIFVTTPTESELFERLEKRNTESPEKLNLRKQTAKEELEQLSQFDYVIYNESGHLDEAVDQILAIIEAEHNKAKNLEENL